MREKDLHKLQALAFAVHEAVLYLDGHPNNSEALAYYHTMNNKLHEYRKEYIRQYGPLTANEVTGDCWSWINDPWPWEGEC